MRKDMNKVVTERIRVGGNSERNTYDRFVMPREKRYIKGVEVDLRPKHESMTKRHRVGGDSKSPSDLLGPLERYLFSKAGNPWDKVWSDICKVFKGNGLQAQHIKQHVKDMVGGIPHAGETMFRDEDWFKPGFRSLYVDTLYVDKNKILRKSPKRKY